MSLSSVTSFDVFNNYAAPHSMLLTHGNPMYLEYFNCNNILFELLVFPIGDEFGRTFAICRLNKLPSNTASFTAVFTFRCSQIEVEYSAQTVSLSKRGQVIQWDSYSKYSSSGEWKANYNTAEPLVFSLDIKILDIEFADKVQDITVTPKLAYNYHSMSKLFSPITIKQKLVLEICLIHNEKLESRLQEIGEKLIFYSDQNWRFYLEPKAASDDLKMSIELILLPPKIIAIELDINIGNEIISNGKRFVFGNDGYDNLCSIAFSNYHEQCSKFEVAITLLKVINYKFEEVPPEKWHRYNIINYLPSTTNMSGNGKANGAGSAC